MLLWDWIDKIEADSFLELFNRIVSSESNEEIGASVAGIDQAIRRFDSTEAGLRDVAIRLGVGAWLRKGPKIAIVPSDIEASLKSIEARYGESEFEQPYDQLLVVGTTIRPTFLVKTIDFERPKIKYAFQSIGEKIKPVFAVAGPNNVLLSEKTVLYTLNSDSTFEEGLTLLGPPDNEECRDSLRAAINFAMLVVNHPHTQEWLNPSSAERRLRFISKAKGEKKKREEGLLRLEPKVLSVQQDLPIWHKLRTPDPETEGGGWSVTPHLRRRHFRMQACGPRWSKRKPMLIQRCLVKGGPPQGLEPTTIIS